MTKAEEHVQRWQEAGLIDAEAAGRILAFEREREAAAAAAEAAREADRPGVLEAVLYLGVAVAAVGVFTLAAENWGQMERWARIAIVGVPAILAILLGLAMRASDEPGVRRGASAAWLAALALAVGTLAVVLEEYRGSVGDNRGELLLIALAATAIALVLWLFSPTHPQVLGLAASLVFLAMAVGAWPDNFHNQLAGMLLLAFGLASLALTEAGLLVPRSSARLLFALTTGFAPWFAGIDGSVPWAELLVFVVGVGLCALSVLRAAFTYMVAGVLTVFVGLVTFIFEHFEDEVGAPVALMLSGACVIAGVLILTQVRGVVRQRRLA